jgi:hypothetical protein
MPIGIYWRCGVHRRRKPLRPRSAEGSDVTLIGRVTVAITPAEEAGPTGRRLLAKLLDLQAAIPVAAGLSQEQIDTALERERASWR